MPISRFFLLEYTPPVVTINGNDGTIRVKSSDGKALSFNGGAHVLSVRVLGGSPGETFLVMENPDFHDGSGRAVFAAVAGGRARVQ